MRGKIVLVLIAVLTLAVAPALRAAEEELFDTKGAAASLEKGLSLLKAKKYDAAITVFEEAAATSPDVEAEAYYYAGYAYYLKGKAGDEESRQKAIEYFDTVYEINPNFTPNKFKPAEPLPVPAAKQGGDVTPAAAAPAGTLAIPQAQPAPTAPPAAPATPAEQPK
jgi:tetratricopeptide (TPR) repeat protein